MDVQAGDVCAACGSEPATTVSIRRHRGMIFLQQFFKVRKPLCRDCGLQLVRSWTLQTLWQGWWGYISFFVNWFVLGANLGAWFKLRGLPQPRPAVAAQSASSERWQSAFAGSEERAD